MRLATVRIDGRTRAVRADDDVLVDVGAPDVGELLGHQDWAERARSASAGSPATYALADADFAPVVPRPSKVICVGLNYRGHIREMGRGLPEHPTLFAKFADALIGARDDIIRPEETGELDWEAELALVVGVLHGRRLRALSSLRLVLQAQRDKKLTSPIRRTCAPRRTPARRWCVSHNAAETPEDAWRPAATRRFSIMDGDVDKIHSLRGRAGLYAASWCGSRCRSGGRGIPAPDRGKLVNPSAGRILVPRFRSS